MTVMPATVDWASVKALAEAGQAAAAFDMLARLAKPEDGFPDQRKYARLFARLPHQDLNLHPLRVAVLANSTTDHFVEVLALWLGFQGFAAHIYQAPFGQGVQEVLDPSSGLYAFAPEIVWFFDTWRDVRLDVTNGADREEAEAAVGAVAREKAALWARLHQHSPALIFHNTADIPAQDIFGHFEANVPWGRRTLLHRYNLALAEVLTNGVTLFDLDHVSARWGKDRWIDERYWHHSKHAFAFDAVGVVAFQFSRMIAAAKGLSRKCLVLDLDNTLWGGVIGDDGLDGIRLGNGAAGEAFQAFQEYVRLLKERGVILAVCSKNEDATAREPFLEHPAMRLCLDDIAVFRANWDNKADNIRYIASTLNIGLDSLVFVDDNPAERALVRACLPMVAVVDLPDDPSGYVNALHRAHLFEAVSFSREDVLRNAFYRANAGREELRAQFANLDSYLASLNMSAQTGPLDPLSLPRSAQLVNKSNQFHLTGKRYSEAELRALMERPDWAGRYFTLSDRFGDNGLISVALLHREGEDAHVDTWVMSCRVLGRKMEEFILNEMVAVAVSMNCRRLRGRYVPSKKNGLVAGLYQRLGFHADGIGEAGETFWYLDLSSVQPLPTPVLRSV